MAIDPALLAILMQGGAKQPQDKLDPNAPPPQDPMAQKPVDTMAQKPALDPAAAKPEPSFMDKFAARYGKMQQGDLSDTPLAGMQQKMQDSQSGKNLPQGLKDMLGRMGKMNAMGGSGTAGEPNGHSEDIDNAKQKKVSDSMFSGSSTPVPRRPMPQHTSLVIAKGGSNPQQMKLAALRKLLGR